MKARPKIIDRILNRLSESRTICIAGHLRPDGDCIGSQVGLALALRHLGKDVTVWNEDPVPRKLSFLDPEGLVKQPVPGQRFDTVVATDCASFGRLGVVGEYIKDRECFINIDHHQSNTRYADINWVSAQESATGELVFRLLKAANWRITPAIADCLFTAVSTDTGSFQYPSTRPSTYHVGGELVHKGADIARICDQVYQSFPLSRVRLLQHVYGTFRLVHQNQIAYFWLKQADFDRTGANMTDTEGLIDHVRAIEPVVVACVFEEEEPDVTRISLRSKSKLVNVNEIARLFDGGGHEAAAGARVPGRPLTVQRKVIGAIKKALDSAKLNEPS